VAREPRSHGHAKAEAFETHGAGDRAMVAVVVTGSRHLRRHAGAVFVNLEAGSVEVVLSPAPGPAASGVPPHTGVVDLLQGAQGLDALQCRGRRDGG
jgi:hypothetical protein